MGSFAKKQNLYPQAASTARGSLGTTSRLNGLQRSLGNAGLQQLLAHSYITTKLDVNPETTAAHLLGNPKYGPYLAAINRIDGLAWRPGLLLFVPDPATIDPGEAQRILVQTYEHEQSVIGARHPNSSTVELVLDASVDPAAAAAARHREQREKEQAAALEWMLRVDDAEEKVRAAVGDSPLLVPRGYSAPLRFSDGAAKFLGDLLREGFGAHIDFKDDLDFVFEPSFPAISGAPGTLEGARTQPVTSLFGHRWTITINAAVWNDSRILPTTAHRLALLAHEVTHAIQGDLPWYRAGIGKRVAAEEKDSLERRYTLPEALKNMSFHDLDPRDEKFLLEQIATRAAYEVLVNKFHVEDKTWSRMTYTSPASK